MSVGGDFVLRDHGGVLSVESLDEAVRAAGVLDREVEVDSLAGSALKVVAEPAGGLVAQVSAVDFRVERGDGSWAEVDNGLVVRGGRLVSRVSGTDAWLSNGGSAEFLRVFDGGFWFGFDWVSVLPSPRVVGDLAVYEDVVEGVDLVGRLFEGGAGMFFVLKTPEAAARVAVEGLSLPVRVSEGLSFARDGEGRMGVFDSAGRVVFEFDDLFMWDSAATGVVSSVEAVEFAGDGRWVSVDVEPVDGVLRISPDSRWLTDAGRVFPVVIDPAANTCQQRGLCVRDSGSSNADVVRVLGSNNKRNRNGLVDGVGYVGLNGWPDVSGSVGGEVEELYLSMPLPGNVHGSVVSAAKFSITQKSSPKHSCANVNDAFGVKLFHTDPATASTTWANRPVAKTEIGVNKLAVGYSGAPSNCKAKEQVWDSAQFPGFVNVIQGLANNAKQTRVGFALRSTHPKDKMGWRTYDLKSKKPVLTITYNHKPSVPSNVNLGSLKSKRSNVFYVANNFVDVFAKATDKQNKSLYLVAKVDGKVQNNGKDQNLEFKSGSVGKVRVTNLPKNKVVSIQVAAHDGYLESGYASTTLKVMYLPDAPVAPKLVSVSPKPEIRDGQEWYLAGTKYSFVFQADKDKVEFIKAVGNAGCVSSGKVTVNASSGQASLVCVPSVSGKLLDFKVTSVSLSGVETAAAKASVVKFNVWADAVIKHRWLFDGGFDDRVGTVGFGSSAGMVFDSGARGLKYGQDQGLRLSDTGVVSSGPVFDVTTSGGLGLWAKWDGGAVCVDVCPMATVLDKDGKPFLSLAVINSGTGTSQDLHWAFGINKSSAGAPVFDWVVSDVVVPDMFTHISGIYYNLSGSNDTVLILALKNVDKESRSEVITIPGIASGSGKIVLGGSLSGMSGVFSGVVDDVIVAAGNVDKRGVADWMGSNPYTP